jgi:hypothetical protein
MTRKTYRTAQGKQIDLGALQLRNENIRAVGNMNVNARGDLIDSWNQPIKTRNQTVGKTYENQVSRIRDENILQDPVLSAGKKVDVDQTEIIAKPPEDFDDDFQRPDAPDEQNQDSSGLAAAIARARQIRQETIQTSGSGRNRPGVKRI